MKSESSHAVQNDPLVEAKLALARGDVVAAGAMAAKLVATRGDDPEVLYFAAVTARMRGDLPAAHRLLDQLIERAPYLGRAWQERGHCHRQAGNRERAIAAYERATDLNPLLTASLKLLVAHYQQADPAKTGELIEKIHDVEGHPPELLAALSAYYDQDYTLAEERIRAYLMKAPADPVAMRLLAELGTRLGEYEDAEFILERCCHLNPGFLPARFDYAEVLSKRFKFETALTVAEKLVAAEPANPQFLMQRANLMLHVGRTEDAADEYSRLQANAPDHTTVSLTYGHALKTLGRIDAAVAAYRRAYTVRPDFGDAYWSLANLKTYRFTPDEIEVMVDEEGKPGIAVDDRIHLCFALGKAFEDAREYARSFEYYQRGNALRQGVAQYKPNAITREFDRQIEHCDAALFADKAGAGCPAPDPIFILGLPRAGSTLLEQILASHSQVEGTTELPDVMATASRLSGRLAADAQEIYPANLRELSAEKLAELGQAYIDSTRIHRVEGTPFFIDKMPNNFRHIGLIHLMLPNARIIDARREPLACGFSVFKQLFAQGQDFSYDLDHIGRYYTDYVRLMDHWDAVLPGRVLKVQHEDVIEDLEGQVRRILDYCGLPFEQSCVEFHRTERAVRTPSSEQVRRPINRDGTEVWKNFDPWLGPLKAALGA